MEKVNILDELKALAEAEAQLAFGKMVYDLKDIKKSASKQIDEIKNYIDTQAKIYGQNSKHTKDIKAEYQEQLERLNDVYAEKRAKMENSRQRIETLQIKAMTRVAGLKKEIKDIKKSDEYIIWKKYYDAQVRKTKEIGKSGNMTEYFKKTDELKKLRQKSPVYAKELELEKGKKYILKAEGLLKENSEKQKNFKNLTKEIISKGKEEKSNLLANATKQNAFSKFIGSIINKVNGSRKFAQRVSKPLKENLEKFKNETVPNYMKQAKIKMTRGTRDAKDFGKGIKNRVIGVVNKGRDSKNRVISELANKIKDKRETAQEKLQNLKKNDPSLEM